MRLGGGSIVPVVGVLAAKCGSSRSRKAMYMRGSGQHLGDGRCDNEQPHGGKCQPGDVLAYTTSLHLISQVTKDGHFPRAPSSQG